MTGSWSKMKGFETHFLNSNRLLSLPPSIVIGRRADESVRDLGLSRELGFRDRGHVDDISSPLSVHLGLGSSLQRKKGKMRRGVSRRERRIATFSLDKKGRKVG